MNNTTDLILKNIIAIRQKRGLSQESMANQLNIQAATYSRLESGKIELNVNRLADIASIFEMSIIDLFTYPNIWQDIEKTRNDEQSIMISIKLSKSDFNSMGLKDKIIQTLNK